MENERTLILELSKVVSLVIITFAFIIRKMLILETFKYTLYKLFIKLTGVQLCLW